MTIEKVDKRCEKCHSLMAQEDLKCSVCEEKKSNLRNTIVGFALIIAVGITGYQFMGETNKDGTVKEIAPNYGPHQFTLEERGKNLSNDPMIDMHLIGNWLYSLDNEKLVKNPQFIIMTSALEPYEGTTKDQIAALTVQENLKDKIGEKFVFLDIRDKIGCISEDLCVVKVRFNDEEYGDYPVIVSETGVLSFVEKDKILSKIILSDTMDVLFNVKDIGNRKVSFNVGGLNLAKKL